MRLSKWFFCIGLFSICSFSFAQLEKQKSDSAATIKEDYLFPIFPGKLNMLTGSMGELRSTHFHAGVDIRTNNMIGIPVRAAMKGYISRIIVGTHGYGKAIFITHPDGNQTLYGHLDKFKGALADYVLKEHYAKKSFDLDLFLPAGLLPVNRGDTIGLSGNTGGSQGPHLHFEIRDSANLALNPLSFNFKEIIDTYPPHASKIALVPLDSNSRINDQFGRAEFYLLKSGNNYVFSKPILAHGRIGIELLANDRMNNSAFRFGINSIEMLADSSVVFNQAINQIDFLETQGIQNLYNYKILKQRGVYFNKLYVDDGNSFPYHNQSINQGILTISNKLTSITILLKDTYGNKSKVKFSLQPSPIAENVFVMDALLNPLEFSIDKNILKVTSRACGDNKLKLIAGNELLTQSPSYGTALQKVYLIDLKKTLVDSVISCAGSIATNLKDRIYSGIDYTYKSETAEIHFPQGALYDTLYFNESYKGGDKEIFTLGSALVPMYKPVEVLLKPKRKYTEDKTTSVYSASGVNLGGIWDNGQIRFSSRELGNFMIQQDLIPPTIARIYLTQHSARFRIRDNRSGIASFEATLNEEWLLMDYEYKTGILLAERLDQKKLMKGDFQLKVTDNAGNEKIYKQKIL